MSHQDEAEENLRIIRSLMEKATIYRAISAEAAALGGVLAILASFAFGPWWTQVDFSEPPREINPYSFAFVWGIVLIVAATANLWFLYRNAQRRGDTFFSPGMKLAVRALAPTFLVAGTLTILAFHPVRPASVVPLWITAYGLALLSTSHFAPPSLSWLGWAFLLAGLGIIILGPGTFTARGDLSGLPNPERWLHAAYIFEGQRWMALTFGLFHLIYAACTWPRKAHSEAKP